MLTAFTVFVLLLLFIVSKTVVVVPMRLAMLVERLGKFRTVLKPGLHILIPFFDRIAYRQETREQVLDIPSQSCITKDNIQVEVDGLVYLKVMDPKRASYGIGDYLVASVNLAQTTMRAEVGRLALDQTFSEREKLNDTIVKEIDKASDAWGIKVLRYEIMNITPSRGVIHTLETQMEAEREKRAEITLAQAQKDFMVNISQGERQEAINISEGEKQKRINLAQGRAREISILAEATSQGIQLVAGAISGPGGRTAVRMRLTESFLEELGKILGSCDISVLPADLAHLKSLLEGLSQATGKSAADLAAGGH
ncbi:MAG: SPFH domain-containing protein [Acidobacteriota bacterium]